MKRAILIVGAGASVEYEAPSTAKITAEIERQVMPDGWMKSSGGDQAFQVIKQQLEGYLNEPRDVNFEHIYHCAHELFNSFPASSRAMNEYRPLLTPFLEQKTPLSQTALRALCGKIVDVIYKTYSVACGANPLGLGPLATFISGLQREFVTRIYTTNYDDFILQAAPDLYTGFPSPPSSGPKRFGPKEFWSRDNDHAVFHLHGSVHLGFPHPLPADSEIGDLYWFDDRAEAIKHARFDGSDVSRMDGTTFMRTSVITGLDKLSRLQQRPMAHYYAALARDLMHADVIYVIGSGLTDLHVNTWLREARAARPAAPIIFVDYWQEPFLETTAFDYGSKEIHLFHDLRVHIKGPFGGTRIGDGWTIASDLSSAIWDRGFQRFLAAPAELEELLARLK
ncbi:SIR2 family protein [Mesorhizobium sp. M0955]|uniref:SIR2 family protein n=1 Tax=unclassified Mesorhizobium TaxID=325217 RepID=UPI00333AC3C7